MANFLFRSWLPASLISTALLINSSDVATAQTRSFIPISRYVADGSVAEIVSASPDGNLIAFTNAGDQLVGFVDITDPTEPEALEAVDLSGLGEPTSVAITPNGRYAVVAVLYLIDEATETIADQQPGTLVFIDLQTREIAGQVPLLGIGPDSVAITPDGSKVVVAIEDEEDTDNLPGQRSGSINIVTIDYDNPSQSSVSQMELDLSDIEGVNYGNDVQPEFVAISPDGESAAVTLQENNAIALIDINAAQVIRIFSAGTSSHESADLISDEQISLTEPFEGRREPDAIAFTPDGQYLVTANEGDTELESFGDAVWSGGRGWSIFDLEGNVVYDSSSSVEVLAVERGAYFDDRSEDRGIELEGTTVAQFEDLTVAFVASERSNFVVAYDISDVESPIPISVLPTGLSPEGVLAIPSRDLLLTANEGDGTIDFFRWSSVTLAE
jgi:DNA-binding beta-propeller fold protein YncE